MVWGLVAIAGAWAYAVLAFRRGEPVNSGCLIIAAVCSYAIGYRFYSRSGQPPRHSVRGP
jgi:carbon starvation protein